MIAARSIVRLLAALAVLLALGCEDVGNETRASNPTLRRSIATQPRAERPPETRAEEDTPLVVFLGDSLTAGFGLAEEEAFPALVERALAEEGLPARVVNAGLSGDTTAGGLRRIEWVLRQEPEVVVIALGGNDGLRGLDLESTERNLRATILEAREAGAEVLLAGMLIPPSYGPDYTRRFAELYPRLAEETGVSFIPFLLEGVAADPDLNLPDGIHPNAAGQARVAATIVPYLQHLLDPDPDPDDAPVSDELQTLPAQ